MTNTACFFGYSSVWGRVRGVGFKLFGLRNICDLPAGWMALLLHPSGFNDYLMSISGSHENGGYRD